TGTVWNYVQSSELLHDEVLDTVCGTSYAHTVREFPNETVNFLTREFQPNANRIIFVGQNIHQDELVESSKYCRNRMFWYVIDRINPNKTILRNLDVISHYFTQEGPVPFNIEASILGCTLPSTASETQQIDIYTKYTTEAYTLVGRRSDEGLFALPMESHIQFGKMLPPARRRRKTDIQRKWRQKIVAEIESLKAQALMLELELERTTPAKPGALPWKEIAQSLQEESQTSVHRNRLLRQQHQDQLRVLLDLAQRALYCNPKRPLLNYQAWCQTSISPYQHPRRFALEWTTTAMYHNTMAMLEKHGVASRDLANYKITCSENEAFEYIWYMHKSILLPYQSTVTLAHHWVQHYIRGGMWPHTTGTKPLDVYGLPDTTYVQTTRVMPTEIVQFLSREFHEGDNRTTIVGQTIHADELYPVPTPYRHRMFWYVLEKASETVTKVSTIHVTSHLCTDDGPVAIEEEAKLMGYDLSDCPEVDRVDRLTQQASRCTFAMAEISTEDRKRRQREGSTRHQRKWRQKIVAEIAALTEQCIALEAEVLRRRSRDPLTLTWFDVVQSLREDNEIAIHRNRALKTKRSQYMQLVSAMTQWVRMASQPLQPAVQQRTTWRYTTLMSQPMPRQLGMDWITQMMFYNTEKMLDEYGVAATATSHNLIDYDVVVSEMDTFEYVWMTQKHVQLPLEHTRELIRLWLLKYTTGAMWKVRSVAMLDTEMISVALPFTTYCDIVKEGPEEMVRFLSREFRDENRSVFVGQNIHVDELAPIRTNFRNRAFWYMLDRVGPNSTKVQMLHITSHLLSPEAIPMSLIDEGALMGCDLSTVLEVDQLDTLTRHANRMAVKEVEGLAASFERIQTVTDPSDLDTIEFTMAMARGWIVQARDSTSPDEHAKYLEYCRTKQKGYRERIVKEIAQLAAKVKELESVLARHQKQIPMLPWSEVAKALADDIADTRMTNTKLKHICRRQMKMILVMNEWVDNSLLKPLGTNAVTWQQTTLWNDPNSRKLAIDWITRCRLHNTELMLKQYGFPGSDEFILDFELKMDENEIFEYVWRDQVIIDQPFELVLNVMRFRLDQTLRGTQWRSPSTKALEEDMLESMGNTRYQRTVRGNMDNPVEYMNMLWREFHDEMRTVIVGQSITDDALLEKSPQSRYMMFWYILDRYPGNQTKLRVLGLSSHYFNSNGYVSKEKEFAFVGYKPDGVGEELELARFRYYMSKLYTRTAHMFERDLENYLAAKLA
ncbi:hypothetical protein THRCLA_06495, partial [Thraustotheca clavata]